VKVGIIVPQGWTGEYDGWDARRAWERTVAVARQAERLGFESIWVFDHFHTVPQPTDEITFESFTTLSALAMATSQIRLGHLVICTGYRNPALTAKMALLSNPQTPIAVSMNYVSDLTLQDVEALLRRATVHPELRNLLRAKYDAAKH